MPFPRCGGVGRVCAAHAGAAAGRRWRQARRGACARLRGCRLERGRSARAKNHNVTPIIKRIAPAISSSKTDLKHPGISARLASLQARAVRRSSGGSRHMYTTPTARTAKAKRKTRRDDRLCRASRVDGRRRRPYDARTSISTMRKAPSRCEYSVLASIGGAAGLL